MGPPPRTIFDVEYDAAWGRLLELPRSQQVRAYNELRTYLAIKPAIYDDVERKLEREGAAYKALRDASEHLGICDRALKVREFKAAIAALGRSSEWSSEKMIRLFGSWRAAVESYAGRPPVSPEQAAMRSHLGGRRRTHEDYLTAVRLWLATDPPKVTVGDYADWARRTNGMRRPTDPVMPAAQTVRAGLARSWPDILRVARGEVSLDDTEARSVSKNADRTDGPDFLIGLTTVAGILSLNVTTAIGKTRSEGFPPVALTLDGCSVWLKEDVEAYAAEQQRTDWPQRSLAERYCSRREVANLLCLHPLRVGRRGVPGPKPIGMAGNRNYWLREDVERWAGENQEVLEGRRRKRDRQGPADSQPFDAVRMRRRQRRPKKA